MDRIQHKLKTKVLRQKRVRSVVYGTASRPRLSVHVSAKHITAQIIDDSAQKTLAYATTVGLKKVSGTMTERAQLVGEEIAKKGKTAKVKQVVFDRGSKLYHGRVKALADAARKEGLEF